MFDFYNDPNTKGCFVYMSSGRAFKMCVTVESGPYPTNEAAKNAIRIFKKTAEKAKSCEGGR